MADKSYKLTLSLSDGTILNAGTITAPQGPSGANGVTFTPSVSSAGVLSWTNNGGLTNPTPISIKGPKGDDAVITESDVAGWGFTKNAGTITGIKMNGASKGTSGVVDLGTVLTAHQDISGLMPKSGGVFTGQVSIGQGDANCLYLGEDGRLNGPSNRTLFGLISGATTFGHTAYALKFRGSGTRPTFNNNEMALKSDIPDVSGKQDKLTAGSNITISGNIISATDTGMVDVDVVGGGNAVTGAAYSASTRLLTLVKGATYATVDQIPDISGKANLSGGNVFQGKQEFENIMLTSEISSISPHRVFSNSDDMLAYIENPGSTYKYTSQTVSAFIANTDANNRTAIVDGRIDNKKSGTTYKLTLPEKEGTLAVTSDIPTFSLSGTTLTITM